MSSRTRAQCSGEKNPRSAIDAAAADWLIAHDVGLADQQEFNLWLAKPGHAEVWAEAQNAWQRLDRLPELSLAPASSSHHRSRWPIWAAVAAAVLVIGWIQWPQVQPGSAVAPSGIVRVVPRQLVLPDGTRVELNADSEVAEQFTPTERRVRLVRGEAHFTVTKNPARPFIVEAAEVGVRAVGTAFNVRLDAAAVEVLVTEGRVQVASPGPGAAAETGSTPAQPPLHPPSVARMTEAPAVLDAGQRTIVGLTGEVAPAQISTVSPDEIARLLAWQRLRLQFQDMPLDQVAVEFNRHNRTQIRVADSAADVLVAGIFSADNVEVFVRFLEQGFRIKAERRGDGTIVLRKAS